MITPPVFTSHRSGHPAYQHNTAHWSDVADWARARAMSGSRWLAGWADQAELLLNQLDRGAAEVLSNKQTDNR